MVEELEKNKVLLKVEVPTGDVDQAIEKAYKSISSRVSIPGFRKGRIPRKIIDARIGKESVLQEALNEMLPVYYSRAVERSGIKPIDKPEIEVVQLKEGQPLLFNAKVQVKPKVKLGKYKGVKAKMPFIEVTDEEIDGHIELLKDRFAQLEPVTRKLRKGDFALINFEGFVDGKPFEGGSANDYLLQVGSGTFAPGFEDKLIGARRGEIREIFIDMPKEHPIAEIAGKKVKFKVFVKEIKQKKLPKVDDEFAKEIGAFETLKELKDDVKRRLEEVKRNQDQFALRGKVLEAVSKGAEVEISEIMVERRVNEMIGDFAFNLKNRGIDLNDYLKATNTSMESLRERFKRDALRALKNELVLGAIGEKEGLEVKEEEVDNEIEKLAQRMNVEGSEVKKRLEERGNLGLLREDILLRKTLDWLVDQAEIKRERKGKKK
ncbi:MAG: trigger factor [Actinomycetota bacterium]